MESDERGLGGEGDQGGVPADEERPAPARPWHRTPMDPEGPPPWTSSEPGEAVWGSGAPSGERDAGQPGPAPSERPPAAAPTPHGAPSVPERPSASGWGGQSPGGVPPATVPPAAPGATPPAAGGPTAPAGSPGTPGFGAPPPGPPAPGATLPPGAEPPPPRTGGGFTRGIFLYIAGSSVLSGVSALLAGANLGTGTAAAVLGIAFVLLFFVALMLRPGPAMDPVRATLGVVSVVFLVGCFALAVGAADQGQVAESTQLVRAAAASGLFLLGMAGIAVLIPSAVAAGLAMLGLVATVVLSAAAAGVEGFGLAVAAVIAGVVDLELAFRVARLRAHPGAMTWMANVAGLLTGLAATALGISFHGTAVACAGLVGAALAVAAWRRHAVVAAVAAVFPLTLVEGYMVVSATGSDSTSEGVVVLLAGLVLLVLVAMAGLRMRAAAAAPRGRPVAVDELLLLAAVVMALVALTQVGSGFTPFQGTPFAPGGGSFGGPAPEPQPTFPTFAPFPTLPPG